MPKVIETTVYSFDELSEDAKEKAIELLYDLNVDYDWWEFTYEDASNIGLEITGFDLDRANYCDGKLTTSIQDSIKSVLSEHGETCETYQTASEYQEQINGLDENSEDFEDKLQDIEDAYLKDMLENYLAMLRNEYEYLTSKEAIIETIQANDYTFTLNGKLKNS